MAASVEHFGKLMGFLSGNGGPLDSLKGCGEFSPPISPLTIQKSVRCRFSLSFFFLLVVASNFDFRRWNGFRRRLLRIIWVAQAHGVLVLKHSENSLVDCSVANGDIIPPASVLRQLSVAIESSKNYKSMKNMITSPKGSSPAKHSKLKLSTSHAKGELLSDLQDEQVLSFFQSILDNEVLTPDRTIGCFMETRSTSMLLSRDIHGAPPESLVAKLAEIMGSFKTLHKMALFWCEFVAELRRLWLEDEYVPGIPKDGIPDLNCCLIYQQLQVINCCISRKKRHEIYTELLESLESEAGCHEDGSDVPKDDRPSNPASYARLNTGELCLRLGAYRPADNLSMLETGEPVYTPLTQEGPLLTEDLIREHEEFVLRTGSLGAGCSQLLSDMQAFKAANPGCILEDFVRWHSPPDWTEAGSSDEVDEVLKEETPRGRLSSRMQKEGNLWLELWETSKAVPSVRQAPLFDEDLAVEGILTGIEEICPSNLFGQLFLTLLGVGFVLAEANLSMDNDDVSRLFFECKDYVVAICEGHCWTEKIGDLCQVYESVEAMVLQPDEYTRMIKQREESGTPRSPFKRLSLLFRGKSKSPRILTPKALTRKLSLL